MKIKSLTQVLKQKTKIMKQRETLSTTKVLRAIRSLNDIKFLLSCSWLIKPNKKRLGVNIFISRKSNFSLISSHFFEFSGVIWSTPKNLVPQAIIQPNLTIQFEFLRQKPLDHVEFNRLSLPS